MSRSSIASAGAAGLMAVLCLAAHPQRLWSHPLAGGDPTLEAVSCPRVVDPKLTDASVEFSYLLGPVGSDIQVRITVLKDVTEMAVLFDGQEQGSDQPITHAWDGRDGNGDFLDPDSYTIRIVAEDGSSAQLDFPLQIVRLGLTKIAADAATDASEWPMVYFKKNTTYQFFATPEIHEYLNVADHLEVSDLDLNNGEPRPSVPIHTATDQPPLELGQYKTDKYNFPLCYLGGTRPVFKATFGETATSADGSAVSCGYPIEGISIRCVLSTGEVQWDSDNNAISPGMKVAFMGPALPRGVSRTDRDLRFRWQAKEDGGTWVDIPGHSETSHRFYTIIGTPRFGRTSGTQYEGPWVEVADYAAQWQNFRQTPLTDDAQLVEAFIEGFFGQNHFQPTAIEGVLYDCPIVGGDGGATHYYSFSSNRVRLSRLLDNHSRGPYVNCSDVASSTSTMLAMLGVENLEMVRLGRMTLRVIWGIGTPDYTNDLWNGGHGFSYHHLITRDDGVHISDACLWVDEDGNPDALPGTPGQNHDRPWTGAPDGYQELVARNTISRTYDPLPGLQ